LAKGSVNMASEVSVEAWKRADSVPAGGSRPSVAAIFFSGEGKSLVRGIPVDSSESSFEVPATIGSHVGACRTRVGRRGSERGHRGDGGGSSKGGPGHMWPPNMRPRHRVLCVSIESIG